jgi:hypothetical protein
VAEPQDDAGQQEPAAVAAGQLVEPGGDGTELFELGEAAFDQVAALVEGGVKDRRSSAAATFAFAVGDLVGSFGDHAADAAATEVVADPLSGVALVAQYTAWPGTRPPAVWTGNPDLLDDLLEDGGVVDVAGGDVQHQWQTPPVHDQVHLGGEPAPGTTQTLARLPVLITAMIIVFDRPLPGPPLSALQQRADERGRSRNRY